MMHDIKIGIFAIQGDYEAHSKMLDRMGVEWRYVRKASDMDGIDGIILPGGESTTHIKVMREEGLWDALLEFASHGALFGTCAGAILLAREVRNPAQDSLGLLDISILRNGYGRQLASDVRSVKTKLRAEPLEMVFIRAPIIGSAGAGVEVLAEYEGHPVLVQQGHIFAATFHPELTNDSTVHQHFLDMVHHNPPKSAAENHSNQAASPAR